MLHHVVRENGRAWHKCVPFLVWAYREVPNATTGVVPYTMLYGRLPRGPLAILKESWAGETELPPNLRKSASKYMSELKENLEVALEYARHHGDLTQANSAKHYNSRAKEKHFEIGDQVVVLTADSTNKLYARWIGPCNIVELRAPYSYMIELPDSSVRHVHANRIRPWVTRVNMVGIIKEDDDDFGDVTYAPTVADDLPSAK